MTMLTIHIDVVLFICLVGGFVWGGRGGLYYREKRLGFIVLFFVLLFFGGWGGGGGGERTDFT